MTEAPMTLWKSQCKNEHWLNSSVKADKCTLCGEALTTHIEVTMTEEGIITKDLLKKKMFLQKFDGSAPQEVEWPT